MGKSKDKQTTEQTSEQEQNSTTSQDQSQTSSGSSTSTRNPYAASEPLLQSILSQAGNVFGNFGLTGQESGAIGGLAGTGQAAANFVPQVGGLLQNVIGGSGGVGQAASTVTGALNPIVQGGRLDPTANPILQNIIQRGTEQAQNAVTSRFSAGGRNFSPAEARAIGEGVADVNARTYYNDYQNQQNRQLQAAGLLNQTALGAEGSQLRGVGMIPGLTGLEQSPYRAQLEAAALERGIPAQNLGMLSNLVLPIAQGFGTTENSQTGQTSGTTSGETSGTVIGSQTGTQEQQKGTNWAQTGIGAALGIAGLLSGNPMLAASGLGTAAGGVSGGGYTGASIS